MALRTLVAALALLTVPAWAMLRPVAEAPVGLLVQESHPAGARMVLVRPAHAADVELHAGQASLRQVASGARAACTGTFVDPENQPVGVVVADGLLWTPGQQRRRGGRIESVASLPRSFVALRQDGRVEVGDAGGEGAHQLVKRLGPVRWLLGGGGPLVVHGVPAGEEAMLRRPGFDARSGVDADLPRPRIAAGRDARGRLLLAACDRPGLPLGAFAAALADAGAADAVFFDGGRTAGLALPGVTYGVDDRLHTTFLVVR